MTIHAVGLLMGACQRIAGLASVIVGPEAERGGIRSMTSRAVALCHLALELPRVIIGVAQLTFARRGNETADRGILDQDMAPDTRNRGVRSRERIEGGMLFGVVLRGQEPVLLVAIGALRMTGGELPAVRVRVAAVALARHGNELAHSRLRVGRMASDARHDGMGAAQGISLCMARRVELGRDEMRPGMAIRAAGIPFLELSPVRVRVAAVALARHGNELAHSRLRVGRMASDARHDGMGASQGISLCMARRVELGRYETRPGMAIRATGIPFLELSPVRVRVATLTRFRIPRVAGGPRIGVAPVIGEPRGVALFASHCRVSFIQRETCQGVGRGLDAPGAFRPRLVGRQMARGAVAGPGRAVGRLVAIGTGRSLHLVERDPQSVDIRHWGFVTIVADRHQVAIRARGFDVSALELIGVVVLEQNRRPERLLAVAGLAGTSQDPGVNVLVAGDTLLCQPQISGTTRLRGKRGQRERRRAPMACITRKALVCPCQRESDMRMVEGIGIAPSPRELADQWKAAAEMVRVAWCTRDRFPSEQEGVIPSLCLDLSRNLYVATKTTLGEPRAGVTNLAGGKAGPIDRVGMNSGQRSRRRVTQGQVDGQQSDHDRAKHQRSPGMGQDHGVPPMIHRSPNRRASPMWNATTASMTMASHR